MYASSFAPNLDYKSAFWLPLIQGKKGSQTVAMNDASREREENDQDTLAMSGYNNEIRLPYGTHYDLNLH